jgi:hypothetical protein
VTTLDATQALESSFRFLQSRGFSAVNDDVRNPERTGQCLQLKRGKENPARARNVSELPQSVRLDFDRGRMNVAIAITPSAVWGRRGWSNSHVGVQIKEVEDPRRLKLHHDMMIGIAYGLERLLVEKLEPDDAARDWIDAEDKIFQAARRRKRQTIAAVSCFLVFIAFVVGLAVYSAG